MYLVLYLYADVSDYKKKYHSEVKCQKEDGKVITPVKWYTFPFLFYLTVYGAAIKY